MEATGARNFFGYSLGGSVALNAAQKFAGMRPEPAKLAVYDAAVNIEGSVDIAWLAGFETAVDSGDVRRAMAPLKRGMQPASPMARIPEPLLALLMAVVSRT